MSAKYKPYDIVSFRLNNGTLVDDKNDSKYPEVKGEVLFLFSTVVYGEPHYEYYVAYDRNLISRDRWVHWLINDRQKDYYLNSKIIGIKDITPYIGNMCGLWVSESCIINKPIKRIDGCYCKLCKNLEHMTVPNQPDGSFICYPCIQNPYRAKL